MMRYVVIVGLLCAAGCDDPGPTGAIQAAGQNDNTPEQNNGPQGAGAGDGGQCTIQELFPLGLCVFLDCGDLIAEETQDELLGCVLASCQSEIAGLSPGCQGCLLSAGGSLGGGGFQAAGLDAGALGGAGELLGCVGRNR